MDKKYDVKAFVYESDDKGFRVRKYMVIEGGENLPWSDAKNMAHGLHNAQVVLSKRVGKDVS
jgi:hypothetical protein